MLTSKITLNCTFGPTCFSKLNIFCGTSNPNWIWVWFFFADVQLKAVEVICERGFRYVSMYPTTAQSDMNAIFVAKHSFDWKNWPNIWRCTQEFHVKFVQKSQCHYTVSIGEQIDSSKLFPRQNTILHFLSFWSDLNRRKSWNIIWNSVIKQVNKTVISNRKITPTKEVNQLKIHWTFVHLAEVMDQKKKLSKITKLILGLSTAEVEQLMVAHCEMSCSVCTIAFKSLPDALYHYSNAHNITDGFIRCCSLKIKTIQKLRGHLIWHKIPDIFK